MNVHDSLDPTQTLAMNVKKREESLRKDKRVDQTDKLLYLLSLEFSIH